GSVYLNQTRIFEDLDIENQDYIRVHTKPRRFLPKGSDWENRIIYDDPHFVVVNKPAGLPVNASVDNVLENVQRYLEETLDQKLFGTHRLDVPTSGLLIFAKTASTQSEINKL